jgi:hypothetical protein
MRMGPSEMPVKRASRSSKIRGVFGQRRKQAKMFRAGLYARVSSIDQQTLPMQLRALREYAVRRGWAIALQVREIGSGAVERKAREQLMEAARRREIDVVLVWRLDRWGRSVTDLLATLQELEHLGVGFISLTEAGALFVESWQPERGGSGQERLYRDGLGDYRESSQSKSQSANGSLWNSASESAT